jgi:microsomal epoxide hydrolase
VTVPTGIANFMGDPVFKMAPRSCIERIYNVAHWTEVPEGGHFAAMERPSEFVTHVRAFARTIGY